MTLFLSTVYFGMLFFVQTTYDLNPSLYLNGVAILVIYFFFSRILYQSEYEIFESKFKIEEKNLILELLNKNLSKSEKKIRQQNIILKEQNKSLDNFAQIVAHDVKAPLKMIQSFSEEVSVKYKNSLEEIDRPLFDYICKGSENLIGIVDGLYDFTQISTKGELKFTKVNFDHTINKTVLLLSKELNANKVQVIIAPGFPVVYGVEELLQNVLLNLFCNAIKFRRQDIDSVVELKHNTGEEGFVEICIRDNGIGIPKDSFEKVFQLFKKLHPSTEYEGFGIGLTTCKKIIEKHDGEIWINSEENQGTSVFFTLLLANIQNIKNRDKILNTALEF
jgi:signal transduction histidine kinase